MLRPRFDLGARIVHRDTHIVVVDKPAGMLTMDREKGGSSGLDVRLAKHLGVERVSVLQRLDQETSGLIAFGLSEEGTRALATQVEARTMHKEYVAAVRGRAMPKGVLEDELDEVEGRSVVVRKGRGKLARCRVDVLKTRADRGLLRVHLETGRMHQIRVQLASRGAPVAGDALYGDVAAPRMLLHCASLAFEHPTQGKVRFTSPPPTLFESWLEGAIEEAQLLETTLAAAMERRHALLASEETTAFRLFAEASDGIPGLAIDVYGEHLVVHLHDAEVDEARLLDQAHTLGFRGVYLKRRPKKAQDLSAQDMTLFAPSEPLRGEAAPSEFEVRENGLRFLVRLGDGMSTGLFLDQRTHRAKVRERASGKRVLNLFAYTCGFTVAAAAGGAASTLSVDAAKRALERGRANLAHAGLDGPQHRFIAEDAFDVLRRLQKRGEVFDVICVDPPTFSTTKSSRWSSGAGWRDLFAQVAKVAAPDAFIVATSNDRRMPQVAFRDHARAGLVQAAREAKRLVDSHAPLDFERANEKEPLLKGLLIELR